MRFAVRARPRAARTEVAGEHGDAVRIRLGSPPVDGAANAELMDFLAGRLGVPRSAVRIVRGHRGRDKVVEVDGIAPEDVFRGLS